MIQPEYNHPIELKGDRIILRPMMKEDLADLQELWKDGHVMRYVGFPKGLSRSMEEMKEWYGRQYQSLDFRHNDYVLAVTDLSGRFLGEAKIGRLEQDMTSHPDVKLLPIYWGKGYAKEVFRLIIEYVFEHMPGAAVKVTPNVLNERAIRLYHSLGFKLVGELETWNPPQHWENVAQPVEYQTMILSQEDYSI